MVKERQSGRIKNTTIHRTRDYRASGRKNIAYSTLIIAWSTINHTTVSPLHHHQLFLFQTFPPSIFFTVITPFQTIRANSSVNVSYTVFSNRAICVIIFQYNSIPYHTSIFPGPSSLNEVHYQYLSLYHQTILKAISSHDLR